MFPSAYALFARSSQLLDYSRFGLHHAQRPRGDLSGVPGTYERRRAPPSGPSDLRDWHLQMAKDFFRSIDYLETRSDIDMERLGYYSLSMGAYFGPIVVSQEPRLKAAVFASGGLRFNYPAEIQPANFAPRVLVPFWEVHFSRKWLWPTRHTPPGARPYPVDVMSHTARPSRGMPGCHSFHAPFRTHTSKAWTACPGRSQPRCVWLTGSPRRTSGSRPDAAPSPGLH